MRGRVRSCSKHFQLYLSVKHLEKNLRRFYCLRHLKYFIKHIIPFVKILGERCVFRVCVCARARARTQAHAYFLAVQWEEPLNVAGKVSALAFALFLMPSQFYSTEVEPAPGSRVHPGGSWREVLGFWTSLLSGTDWAHQASPGSAPRD